MSAKIISDNKFDHDLARYKAELEALNRDAQAFMVNFLSFPAKERAARLQKIQSKIREISRFVTLPHQQDINTAGTRFNFENLKNSFSSFQARWLKFEKSLG